LACGQITYREDQVCETCWRRRKAIEDSDWQRDLASFVAELEREWRMLDRIDEDQRRERRGKGD